MASPFQGDDVDPFSGARDEEGNVKQVGLAPTAKTSRFGAAFAAARRAGDKTFMFNGKKYTTDVASAKKPSGMRTSAQEAADDAKIFGAGAAEEGVTASGVSREARGSRSSTDRPRGGMKKGGKVKMASGGKVSSASKRADGCATKGKTRGRII
jgi:hypothetical protein